MLPERKLSSEPVTGEFLFPDSLPYSPFADYEYGGVAHQDPSLGLMVKVWKAYISNGHITVAPVDGSRPPIEFAAVTGLATYVSLAFDQNMRVVLTWFQGSTSFLFWYNSVTQGYETTPYPGCYSPRLAMDDKRSLQTGASDVIFAYIKGKNLCTRTQRDRYLVEDVMTEVEVGRYLRRIGMNTEHRIQFELI